jgi:hypothetical protein
MWGEEGIEEGGIREGGGGEGGGGSWRVGNAARLSPLVMMQWLILRDTPRVPVCFARPRGRKLD